MLRILTKLPPPPEDFTPPAIPINGVVFVSIIIALVLGFFTLKQHINNKN